MTTTSSTTGTLPSTVGASITTSQPTKTATQSFNSDMFMQLLVTQLKNQDPSSPMDSNQMVQQTSALASMEQLTSLNSNSTTSLSLQQRIEASNVLGKQVTWSNDGTAESGVVTSVAFSSTGEPQLTVGSSTVALSSVTGVTQATSTS